MQDLFDMNARRAEAADTYRKLFLDNRLNAILMPPAPHTAVPLDRYSTATYHCLWNYLDFPASVIPVDHVREIDVMDSVEQAKYGPGDKELYSLYTGPEQYKDAPICVQVVGYRHKDERLLNIMAKLDSIVNEP